MVTTWHAAISNLALTTDVDVDILRYSNSVLINILFRFALLMICLHFGKQYYFKHTSLYFTISRFSVKKKHGWQREIKLNSTSILRQLQRNETKNPTAIMTHKAQQFDYYYLNSTKRFPRPGHSESSIPLSDSGNRRNRKINPPLPT